MSRGGDRWQHQRTGTLSFRLASAVHRLGRADGAAAARACGLPATDARRAYRLLRDICERPHLYHIRHLGDGVFSRDDVG